jgi:hypothetical protein
MSSVLGADFVKRLTQPQVEFLLEALERNMAGHLPRPAPGGLEAYSPHYVRSCVAGFMKYDIRFPPSKHTTPLTKAVGEEVLALLKGDPEPPVTPSGYPVPNFIDHSSAIAYTDAYRSAHLLGTDVARKRLEEVSEYIADLQREDEPVPAHIYAKLRGLENALQGTSAVVKLSDTPTGDGIA